MDPLSVLQLIAECYCTALATSIGGAPGSCCVVSSDPVIPECCNGFAWVRMTNMQPVYAPNQPNNCGGAPATWKMYVELGIARCAPALCGAMENPCCENEAAAVNVQFGDWQAAVAAVTCCLTKKPADPYAYSIKPSQVIVGNLVVDDPSGGCVSQRLSASIQFDSCIPCP